MGDKKIGDEKINKHSQSVLFTAADLQKIMHKRDDQVEFLANLELGMAKFEKERDEVKFTLDKQIAKDNINYEEMTSKRIAEKLAEAKAASDKELEQMSGFLQ